MPMMRSWEGIQVAAESLGGSSFQMSWDSVVGPGWPGNLSSDDIHIARPPSVFMSSTPRRSLALCSPSWWASFGLASGWLDSPSEARFLDGLLAPSYRRGKARVW